jgi:endo-1,4-beta-xylanase
MSTDFGRVALVALAFVAASCSNTGQNSTTSSGGAGGRGGITGLGGASGSGGSSTATSTSQTGGAVGSGGTVGSGGVTSTGGTTSAGGMTSTGGTTSSGGTASTGGTTEASGGVTGTGGSAPKDGGTDTGGVGGRDAGTDASTLGGSNGGMSGGGGTATGGGTGNKDGAAGAGGTIPTGGTTGSGGTSGTTCATTPATLKAAADCTGRLIGVALSTQHISESSYASAAREFNYVTPENEMKWSSNEPTRNQFSFSAGDQIVSFANANGMKVKGHALVWHNQLPSWASSLSNAADARAAMLAHIKGVVEHYKGKVQAWDVVNEAVSLDGTGYRDSPFYRYLGITFIDEAFAAARAADPDAKLYYNDYNCEGLSLKANKVFDLVKGMKSRNVLFDGVGMQMHYGEPNEAVPTADFVANMQRYVDLGLDILLSEMDVHVCAGLTPTQQQTIYHDLIAACVAQSRCIAMTFWGITDKYSWLNNEPDLGCSGSTKPLGLLWDDNFKKKPAYTGVLNALSGL